MAIHLICAFLTFSMIGTAVLNFNFFAWHPILMSLSFSLFMTQGILIFSKQSSIVSNAKYPEKVSYHTWIQFSSLFLALGGFGVIYWNKMAGGKQHFTTWHGLIGVMAVGASTVQCLAGLVIKYPTFFKLPRPFVFKLLHSTIGTFVYVTALAALLLATYSTWFSDNVHVYIQGPFRIAVVVSSMIIMGQLGLKLKSKLNSQR